MRARLSDFGSAELIKIIRESTGLNQKDFGKKIGKSKRSIISYENGTSSYNSHTLELIYKEFGIDLIVEDKKSKNKMN